MKMSGSRGNQRPSSEPTIRKSDPENDVCMRQTTFSQIYLARTLWLTAAIVSHTHQNGWWYSRKQQVGMLMMHSTVTMLGTVVTSSCVTAAAGLQVVTGTTLTEPNWTPEANSAGIKLGSFILFVYRLFHLVSTSALG